MDNQVQDNNDLVENKTDQVSNKADQVESKKKKVEDRADQDQVISNFIGDLEANLDSLDADAELAAKMAKKGFDADKRLAGRGFLTTLKTNFQARQVKLGMQGEKSSASEGAEKVARLKYTDFRSTVRTAYTDTNTRMALGVSGLVPADTEKFLTLAEAGYMTATQTPYAAALEALGFDTEEQVASVATITALKAARQTHRGAIASAKAATKERDDTYKVALKWNRDLLRMAKIALRERPDLLAKLR